MKIKEFIVFLLALTTWMFFQIARADETQIIVAIIDTGLDVKALPSTSKLWQNLAETGLDQQGRSKASNGIDDDKNGFIDDVNGFNFAADNNKINDQHGHGTHVTGIIHKLNPKAQIMVLKYYEPGSPLKNLENTTRAIRYAVKMGAHIINYSGGGQSPDRMEYAALKEAEEKGVLVVAASGNEGYNNDLQGFFPASYQLKNIVSVGSTDDKGQLLKSSNYGERSVDIAAEGENIISNLPGDKKGSMTGTSQAAAFVSGVASRIMERFKTSNFSEVKEQLVASGAFKTSLNGRIRSGRQIELDRAIASRDSNRDAFDRVSPTTYNLFENDFIYKHQ
jgi:thermitase